MINSGEAIILNNQTYICACNIQLNGRTYLYLVTADEPVEVCFAEQLTTDDAPQIQVVTDRPTKERVFAAIQAKVKTIADSLAQNQTTEP